MDKANKSILAYDPKSRETFPVAAGEQIEVTVQMHMDMYVQLASKIALSAGYYVYSNWFRNNVQHEDLHTLMKGSTNCTADEISAIKTRMFDLLTSNVPKNQNEELEFQKMLCRMVDGSIVIFSPGPKNIVVTVGILGEFVAMLNIPACIDGYPRYEDAHDLGHVVQITKGKIIRGSQRSCLQKLLDHINRAD